MKKRRSIMMNKWSKPYEVLRLYAHIIHSCFYRKIIVKGRENIPDGKPVIFAPNHQNALMDPMAILFTQRRQTIFLTRADIFNNPILLKIFTFLKMLPVYRIRDGAESLQNNERIFNESVKVLESKDRLALALFPEARHTDRRYLWPLKKAVQRIAFQAMDKHDFNIDIQIVPVGIYYSDYPHSQTTLQVNYGHPISVNEFKEIYKENAQKGMSALRDAMTNGIQQQMIHIEHQEKNDFYEFIRLFFRKQMLQHLHLPNDEFFKADQATIALLDKWDAEDPESFANTEKLYADVQEASKHTGASPIDIQRFSFGKWLGKGLLSLLSFPVFLFAFINAYWLHFLINRFLRKKVKDKQFHSSIKYGISLFLPVVVFPLQAAILAIFLPSVFIYYLAALILTSFLGIKARYLYTDWMGLNRVLRARVSKQNAFNRSVDLQKQLENKLKEQLTF